MSVPTIKVGLCGFGVVGQGVFRHIGERAGLLAGRLGAKLEITRIAVRDMSKKRDFEYDASILCDDPLSIAQDDSVDILCELMGGTGTALEVTLEALKRGKIVVSANKALICDHGREIFLAAEAGGGSLLYEASVAGGIPVIKAIRDGLVANRISSIYGILNGTCNYILTRMSNEGASYHSILSEAKELGYAEADESLDVDGIDTAHKAIVLAYLAFGRWVPLGDILVQGIAEVTQEDIAFARESGYSIKLLAVVDSALAGGKLYISILPTLVPKDSALGGVHGVYNAVSIHGDVVGETVYIGPGAGRDATASAVIADLGEAVRLRLTPGVGHEAAATPRTREVALAEPKDIRSRYYLRLKVADRPGVMADVASLLAARGVSLASVTQKEVEESASSASLIITTHATSEHSILQAAEALKASESVESEPFIMPIGAFGD